MSCDRLVQSQLLQLIKFLFFWKVKPPLSELRLKLKTKPSKKNKMKFKIIKAEIRTVPMTAKTNPGAEYIYATAKMHTKIPFGAQPHRMTMFMEPEEIEIWRDLIDAADGGVLNIDYPAEYVIVEGLPSFRTKSNDGVVNPEIRNSMRVLVRIDEETGKHIEDARSMATRMVAELMDVVVNNSAPVTVNATVVNEPAPAVELTAEEQLAALQAQIAAKNNLG
jgi:hypothetical protein